MLMMENNLSNSGQNSASAQDYYKVLHFGVLNNPINEICEGFQENDINTLIALWIFRRDVELSLFNAMPTGEVSLFRESKLVHSRVNVGNLLIVFNCANEHASCEKKKKNVLLAPTENTHGKHHETL